MKLARLLAMSDGELAKVAKKLEADPRFQDLVVSGALAVKPFGRAFFATRRFAGMALTDAANGVSALIDSKAEPVRLIKKIGRQRFESLFLGDAPVTDKQRAKETGLSLAEVASLRGFLDEVFVREEFSEKPAAAAPKVFSTVAGIVVQGGRPVLRFFNREVWKGRYKLDDDRLKVHLAKMEREERERTERYLSRLSHVDRRKTTLYRVLETLLEAQARFLVSGDPCLRQPLTQRSLSAAVDADPSVINRLIANKAVELPWGTEAPMKVLVPSGKTLAKETVGALARDCPEMSDEKLRLRLAETHQIHLSRRSVAQYRSELGLGGRGRR
jgi:RNA polymerase sigma-54 factor